MARHSDTVIRMPVASAVVAWIATIALAGASADTTPQPLPFAQDWSDTLQITSPDDWSGVPGIAGYRGDGLTLGTGTDPQTILADGGATPVDVNANTEPGTGLLVIAGLLGLSGWRRGRD